MQSKLTVQGRGVVRLPFQLLLGGILAVAVTDSSTAENWPRFRGPNGTGVAEPDGLPANWSEAQKLWTVTLPGIGHGSPVIWRDKIFLTAGDEKTGDFKLVALSVADGDELWHQSEAGGTYDQHDRNSYASTTPVVDAMHVYATWATPDNSWLAAYTHDGKPVWRKSLGRYESSHGFANSPMVADGVVVFCDDQLSESFIVGFDAKTGNELWRTPRPSGKAAYATPCVVEAGGGKKAIIVNSMAAGMASLDLFTGKELWRLPDVFPARCVSSPILAEGLLMAACGGGGSGKQLVAIEPNATNTDATERYRLTRGVPYVPTPLVADGLMYLWHDGGRVMCVEVATGKTVWQDRIGGSYGGSPIVAGNAVVAMSMEGEAVFLATGREFKRLATLSLDGSTQATPAVADGKLYLRTESTLHCVGVN